MKTNVNDLMAKTTKLLSSSYIKDNIIIYGLACIILLILIIAILYLLYMLNLNSRECNLMNSLYSVLDKNIKNLNDTDDDCGLTLKDYYINTAYNCCSGGSYKNDYVNTCILKNILKQGVRGLDFEIYSIDDNPVVATSTVENYNVKETFNYVNFSDVMNVIVNNGFSPSYSPNYEDPIFLHLRIMSSNQQMYSNFAQLFKQYQNRYLLGPQYSYEYSTCNNNNSNCVSNNLGNVKLISLKGKVIIIVDKINNDFIDNQNFYEFVNMTSNSMFMRALNYYDVKFTPDMNELQEFNKKNMTICMPDKGITPDNPSALISRALGCQMTAMRYQSFDTNLQENIAFFDKTGYAFALKPENLRYKEITIEETPPNNPLLNFQTRTTSSDFYNFST